MADDRTYDAVKAGEEAIRLLVHTGFAIDWTTPDFPIHDDLVRAIATAQFERDRAEGDESADWGSYYLMVGWGDQPAFHRADDEASS